MSTLNVDTTNLTELLNLPVLTTAQRNALSGVQAGTIIFNSEDLQAQLYSGTAWTAIGESGGALYTFTSAVFTSGGATFQTGPSLAQARTGLTGTGVDAWKNNTLYFNTSNGIQLWTVPKDGTYRIEAIGAQGGNAGARVGGRPVSMRGDFVLTKSEIIRIIVGQQGQSGGHSQDGQPVSAGGGGSFVVKTPYNTNPSILVIAGGGGGAAQNSWSVVDGLPASTGNNGSNNASGNGGGTGGNGATGTTTGGPGAGFFTDGATPSGTGVSESARSFTNGGAGGRNARSWAGAEIYGGFGGGGGGGGLSAGGGGGYSGGAAGTWTSPQQGGGGGSYNNGTNQLNQATAQNGSGQVTITFLG
jgi:hypothetical protein